MIWTGGFSVNESGVTRRQIMALAFIGLLSPAIRAISESEMAVGEKGVYLSPIAAAVPVLLLFLLTDKLSREGTADELFRRVYGKTAGGVVTVIFVLWMIFYTGLVLRVAGDRLVSCVYSSSHWAIFAAVIAAVSAFAAAGGAKALTRTAGLLLPIIITALAGVFLLLTADIKLENLFPLTPTDIKPALTGSLHMISVGSLTAYYCFLPAERHSQKRAEGIGYAAGIMAVMTAVTVTVVGILGAELASAMESTFFVVIRNVRLFNILERIEAVVVALWVVSDIAFVSGMMMVSAETMKRTMGMGRKIWTPIIAVAALATAATVSRTTYGIERVIQNIAPIGNMILVFAVLPVTYGIGKLKRKDNI